MLLVEDVLSSIALLAMIASSFVDIQSRVPPIALLCLHASRIALLVCVSNFEEAISTWPVLPAVSVGMVITCAFIKCVEPYEFITYVLFGQAMISSILAMVTSFWIWNLLVWQDQQPAIASNAVLMDASIAKTNIVIELKDMTKQVAQTQDMNFEDQSMCVICLSGFQPDEMVVELTCRHIFHDACIRTWAAQRFAIPVCPMRCHGRR